MEKICDRCRTKKRGEEELRLLKNRILRIEGQVRGIGRMLDSDAYCTDILTQVSAINSALCAFSRELLSNHIRTCVSEDIKAGREETVDDLLDTIYKLMK
jgi:DNA-binding FrmR family transcriptional regulator